MRKMTMRRMALATSAAIALGGGIAVLPATAALAAYTCHYSVVTPPPGTHGTNLDVYYAGYYSGNSTQPSTSGVSNAGIEAQCLLKEFGYNPGTIDGVFGSTSQAAAKKWQKDANSVGAGLTVDGKIGPNSWPVLRHAIY